MTKPAWDILVVYADVAWRDRVAVALDGRTVRSLTVEQWAARSGMSVPTPQAIILQAGSVPGSVGPETIGQLRRRDPDSRLVIIGPVGEVKTLQDFGKAGVDDAFAEPASPAAFAERVQRSLLHIEGPSVRAMRRDSITTEVAFAQADSPVLLKAPNADHATLLEEDDWDAGDNARRLQDIRTRLRRAYLDSTKALVAAAEAKEKYARRHSVNVAQYAERICGRLGLAETLVEQIKTAAILHDVGKIGIPDSILAKPGRLTEEEFEIIKQHPQIAMDILGHVSFLEAELPMILHHHERYDGTGYPARLAGTDIPLGARVIAVADAVEVMLARRSYKNPYDVAHVRTELRNQAGKQFDPTIAAATIEWMGEPQAARILQAKTASASLVYVAKPEPVNQPASLRNTV